MALSGHLSDLSLSELIEFFCNQRKTGLLKVLYPQGPGHFYLQSGSVVDARVGALRGIDAVYFALTLPNAKFEFSGAVEPSERTINQPWTQVVLEGLRRLDEGIAPASAFNGGEDDQEIVPDSASTEESDDELENLRVPSFLSFKGEGAGKRKMMIGAAVAFALVASVAVIGVPAGWYNRAKTQVSSSQVAPAVPATETAAAPAVAEVAPETSQPAEQNNDAALAAKRQHEKEQARLREQKALANRDTGAAPTLPAPTSLSAETAKAGPKKVTVTVTYDESGRVTQASGADATALRIARQKRFPAGKAGSTTVTIPIN
ncbi:MAG TPA: DUF4388 domain-containing protein [Pyrinomonadaceae bacterium]|nr:DUF4388 domain-containing protein [Pyrinomonadaceae bacterium]